MVDIFSLFFVFILLAALIIILICLGIFFYLVGEMRGAHERQKSILDRLEKVEREYDSETD